MTELLGKSEKTPNEEVAAIESWDKCSSSLIPVIFVNASDDFTIPNTYYKPKPVLIRTKSVIQWGGHSIRVAIPLPPDCALWGLRRVGVGGFGAFRDIGSSACVHPRDMTGGGGRCQAIRRPISGVAGSHWREALYCSFRIVSRSEPLSKGQHDAISPALEDALESGPADVGPKTPVA
ncbi:hypothetical protein AVEN_9006-1 [Araneus ventricosus]|uniref:Uncharacterized protein n=1 Tax=Araneus ventricosus TaxID=182803 RepID=A0A4Y2DPG0_ARAVE|nr:hypothetical protein AVEN_9006-1 [Araneus ventricosus]